MKLILFLAAVVSFLGCGWQEVVYRGATLHLTIELDDSQGAIADPDSAINSVLEVLRARVDEYMGLRKARVEKVGKGRITVELFGLRDVARAKSIIQQRGFLEFKILTDGVDYIEVLPALDSLIAAASPGLDETRPLTMLMLDSGEPGVLLVEESQVETAQGYLAWPEVRERIPKSVSLVWGTEVRPVAGKLYYPLYILEPDPIITSEDLEDAEAIRDPQFGTPVVPFKLTRQGGRTFEQATSQHVGDRMAIILDGQVQGSPPVIREPIGRRAQMELGKGVSIEEAQDIALILRTGALPVPINIVEERTHDSSQAATGVMRNRRATR
jgi:preprotein translocase subunit SecD